MNGIRVQFHSFASGYPVFPKHLLKRLSFPHYMFLAALSEISWRILMDLFLVPLVCFIGLYIYLYASTIYCFNYCSFVIYFEIRNCDTSRFVLSQDCFGILHLFILGRCLTGLYQNIFSCGNFCFMKWSYIIVIYVYLLND